MRVLITSFAAALAGCYDPSVPGCLYRCAEDRSCPSGTVCDLADEYCKVPGEACTPPLPVAPCDPMEEPDLADGVFVSGAYGSPGGSGDDLSPLDKIGPAVVLARTLGRAHVYVDEGTYTEAVTITDSLAGVTVDGSWSYSGLAWKRDCSDDRARLTLIRPDEPVGVTFSDVTHTSGLSNLSVGTAARAPSTPGDTAGGSRFAVVVRGDASSVRLYNVFLLPGDGDHGGPATPGAAGTSTRSCDGSTDCQMGAAGIDGVVGADATVEGMFTRDGFTPADGGAGISIGAFGENGSPGEPTVQYGDCNTGCGCGSCITTCSGPLNCNGTVTVIGGTCGCGGNGGSPGAAGRGGGASVGLLAVGANATVSVEFTVVQTGDGGDGSPGGIGGDGALGTGGVDGQSGRCYRRDCTGGCPGGCNYQPDATVDTIIPTRQHGGNGGAGGKGSRGGGGAGGPSFAVVTIGTARALVDKTSVLLPGAGGRGGDGAVAGNAGALLRVP